MTVQLPEASGTFGDKPVLTFPDTPAPEELEVRVLEQGSGDEVQAGQTLIASYFGQVWRGGMFDNSYDRGATPERPSHRESE